jgi:hypothetical protein
MSKLCCLFLFLIRYFLCYSFFPGCVRTEVLKICQTNSSFCQDPDLSWDEGDMPNNRIQIWSLQDFMEQYNNMYSWLNNIQVRSNRTTCTILLAQQHPGTQQYSNMYSWLNNIPPQVRSNTTTCTPGSTTSRYAAVQKHVLLAQQHPGT